MPPDRIVRGNDPAPGVELAELVRHDAAERRFDGGAPRLPLVGGKIHHVDGLRGVLFARSGDPVDDHDQPPVAQGGNAGAVVAERQTLRALGQGTLRRPGASPVGRFREHEPRIAAVAVMGALGEDTDEFARSRQGDVRPRFVESGIVADAEFFDLHGRSIPR